MYAVVTNANFSVNINYFYLLMYTDWKYHHLFFIYLKNKRVRVKFKLIF